MRRTVFLFNMLFLIFFSLHTNAQSPPSVFEGKLEIIIGDPIIGEHQILYFLQIDIQKYELIPSQPMPVEFVG